MYSIRLLVLVPLLSMGIVSCKGRSEPPKDSVPPTPTAASPETSNHAVAPSKPGVTAPPQVLQTVSTRGVLRSGPQKEGDRWVFAIAHEDIPDFKDSHGKVVGMPAMVMRFSAPENAIFHDQGKDKPVADLKEGDHVVFDFEVLWDQRPQLRIVKMIKLTGNPDSPMGSLLAPLGTQAHGTPRAVGVGIGRAFGDGNGAQDRAKKPTPADQDPVDHDHGGHDHGVHEHKGH